MAAILRMTYEQDGQMAKPEVDGVGTASNFGFTPILDGLEHTEVLAERRPHLADRRAYLFDR